MPSTASWSGTPSIKGSSESMRMALLTFSLVGIQFTWGIEMTYCTPYLLQLGLTKSRTSLVWVAGPLSGLIMQPVVGVLADNSKSRWGRRRPYMVVGALIVAVTLLVLGWTSEVVGLFISDPELRRPMTIALAVLSIYVVDFAINAVQASCRSLIVDTLPISKQQMGSAWASRMIGIGHLLGYVAGTIDLMGIFGTSLGDNQFKQLTVISSLGLLIAVGITCYSVQERVLISGRDTEDRASAVKLFSQILRATLHLPARIQAICWIQFWSWIGWFPFLFYSTTWVGEIYFRYNMPEGVKGSSDVLGDVGRIGSLSLVVFSVISLASSIVLPWIVKSPDNERPSFTPRPPASIAPIVTTASRFKPDLLDTWTFSHLLFAGSMILAPFVTSLGFATVLVSICGIPWALSCWAPFTFMGIEINRLSVPASSSNGNVSYNRLSTESSVEMSEDPATTLRLNHHPDDEKDEGPASSSTGELAGVYLGILNLFTTLPQFIGTFISTVAFALLEPGKSPELAHEAHPDEHHSTDGPNAIGVCLFIGAVSAVGAAYATKRLGHIQ
ncbi:MFS general substrate transporter [Xylona heveae TC161]|uniref:MFS general substrate transporter n=1 Tax=Xylona heveae (strain CBS 132557 / TC161) TaxID=1328760 RepID=A0A165JAQ3_XYLHT|nr:MFS general substrate transporter [Xylona heveae TC161]KZF25981.1 MFS general substrate transporter [Xylona heveae TC161]